MSDSGSSSIDHLLRVCREARNTEQVATLASIRGGLRADSVRRIAWPILLGCNRLTNATGTLPSDWQKLPPHKDEDQVRLDVNRSFVYYPKNESEIQLDRRKSELSDLILAVLRSHPMLCYFQGFHDIVQVVLLVMGKDLAFDIVTHLSLLRIRDFMLPSLSASLAHLRLLPAIVYSVDSNLYQHLSQTQPYFALAATLTLYAHEIQDYGDIARLFDFLLAHEAVVSVYLFAVIILMRKDELLEMPADEPEMLYFTLSKLPHPLDVEDIVERTATLFAQHPPERLPFGAWRKVSAHSVLKTTRGSLAPQTLSEGEELFVMQVQQLRRIEFQERVKSTLWKHRRPAGSIGLAILIGLVSVCIQKGGIDGLILAGLRRIWQCCKMIGL